MSLVKSNSGTGAVDSRLFLGNNIPAGTAGATRGVISIYDTNQYKTNILAGGGTLTADRDITLPNETGTVITDYSTSGNGSFEVEVADNSWVKWIKVGKVVWVSCGFTVTGAITDQSYVVSNLPKPKLVDDFNFVFLFGGDGTSYRIQLIVASTGASGQLKNYYGRHVPQNVGINGTFMYIAE